MRLGNGPKPTIPDSCGSLGLSRVELAILGVPGCSQNPADTRGPRVFPGTPCTSDRSGSRVEWQTGRCERAVRSGHRSDPAPHLWHPLSDPGVANGVLQMGCQHCTVARSYMPSVAPRLQPEGPQGTSAQLADQAEEAGSTIGRGAAGASPAVF